MTQPVSRSFTSIHDNQTHPDDYEPNAPPAASQAKAPSLQRPSMGKQPTTTGQQHLVASKPKSTAAEFARARQPSAREAGVLSDAAKTFGSKALGPLETPLKVAAYCARNATACAAVGTGYLLYEAVFGAEAGPLPPLSGGNCEPGAKAAEPQRSVPTDVCERESSVECLPLGYRDGLHE